MTIADFSGMSRKELRYYVLSHREDEDALRVYMDRLHNDPDVARYTGDFSEESLAKLEQLIQEQANSK